MNIRICAFTVVALCLPLVCGAQSDEDIDAASYSKILPVGVDFHYRDVPEGNRTSASRARSGTQEFPIEENTRARIEEIMAELFLEELGDTDNFTLTDEPRSHRPDRG